MWIALKIRVFYVTMGLGFEGFDGLTTESTTGADSFIRDEHWIATQL